MSDLDDHDGGDEPDTFDGRLNGITRLIDTFDNETDEARRQQRRAVITRLLTRLRQDASDWIDAQLERLDDL